MSNLMRIPEYAKSIGRSPTTIRLMCREGRIPGAVKYGTDWLINLALVKNVKWNKRGRPPGSKNKPKGRAIQDVNQGRSL